MKLRTVLNGIAALAVVGGLYTFAFCMKDEVNTDSISGKFYETSAETQQTEQTDTVQTEKASIDIFSDAAHNKVLKEKADIPESAEEAQVNKRFGKGVETTDNSKRSYAVEYSSQFHNNILSRSFYLFFSGNKVQKFPLTVVTRLYMFRRYIYSRWRAISDWGSC